MEHVNGAWRRPDHKRDWDTNSVGAGERFAYYREAICQAFMELVPTRPRRGPDGFFAQVESVPLGPGAVNRVHAAAHQVTRSTAEIAASSTACYYLNYQRRGECRIIQAGEEIALMPGQVGIFSSDTPFVLEHERRHDLGVASFWVPHDALAERLPGGVPTKPLRLSDNTALGRLIAETASTLDEVADTLDLEAGARLFGMLLDLTAMALSGAHGARVDGPAAIRGGLAAALRRSVAAHAHDPALSVERIAAHHGISTRYVHKLFAQSGTTFSAYLTALRLDGAARDLRDPAKAHLPVGTIGFDWGFKDTAHFGRRFKARFAATPLEWRREGNGTSRPS